jgi:hypothetical protein
MSAELVAAASALGGAASTAFVTAMINDTWSSVRKRVALVFGRKKNDGTPNSTALDALDEANKVIAQAPPPDRPAVAAASAQTLRDTIANLLVEDPTLMPDVRSLLQELQSSAASGGTQTATASGDAQQAVQFSGFQQNTFKRGES